MTEHVSNMRHYLTIDLIANLLSRSIFHPFVAWTLPLCMRAINAPYESNQFKATCVYAASITLLWLLSMFNHRLAHGVPREVNWEDEVVVVTGGSSGLGKVLAETYSMRGASIAVLDVRRPDAESEAVSKASFYECDVGDVHAVKAVRARIEKEVSGSF